MLPPFPPFTARPVRRLPVKRLATLSLLRDLEGVAAPSVKAERLVLKPDRAPAGGRLRVLDR